MSNKQRKALKSVSTDGFESVRQQDEDFHPNTSQSKNDSNKHLKRIIYMLIVIITILTIVSIVLIVYVVKAYSNVQNENDVELNNSISVDSIDGIDDYLKSHCVLHTDIHEVEGADPNGQGVTVIRNPTDIPAPINIAYTPLLNDTTGEIQYFKTKDSNGNLVAKPLCQTDFDTSTYTMKGNSYTFDTNNCEFPLPKWMNETDIINLPRRYKPITHRITLTTTEVVAELEPGHTFEFFTYNATVPGPPIRVRVGDWIDLTLINPVSSSHEHSIDFHAMCGPGGGAVSLRVNPGEQARTVWQAIIPGMFIYHCASGWVSHHISMGNYGAIIVEPEDGFPYSDMDIYLGQGELYLNYPLVNNVGTQFSKPKPDLHNTFDPIKERYEMSDVVMFNGAPFSLVHNPIITTVGSVVRCFIVSGGPNHISSFHIIGDSFDRVWLHADFNTSPQQNIQTTTVPPGGCAVADWRHDTPGSFIVVDHALTRTFVKGNLGVIRACDPNDLGCISGSSSKSIGTKYTCHPNRYVDNNTDPELEIDTLLGNDDCLFCPWYRDDFDIDIETQSIYDAEITNEIYNYLNQQCNTFNSDNAMWQGDASRYNDTVSNIINGWRKNRYPGIQQWKLSDNLRIVDPMIGNPRHIRRVVNGTDNSTLLFDDSECVITVGSVDSIMIRYSIQRSGHGQIKIFTDRFKFNDINGGWISFGRGGDGISTMKDSHVETALFSSDGSDIEFVSQVIRDYATPLIDTSNNKFPISTPSLIFSDNEVIFTFDILSGDWIEPSSGSTTVPMIIAVGTMGNRLETTQMVKHFEKDIVHLDTVGEKCLFGGTQID